MPISLTKRLASDEEFRKKILKLGVDYVQNARSTLDYYTADFDAAHDLIMCFATLTKADYVKLAKGHPRRFVLPITATHIHTMTTFLAQALFGGESPHKVDAGAPESEAPARVMNELLKWNAQQQHAGIYQLGFMWVENALTYNRGIFYEQYAGLFRSKWAEVEEPKLDDEGEPVLDAKNQPVVTKTIKKTKERIGGYNRLDIVSPYDFFIDPIMPLYRFQEGRFAGHRVNLTWNELQRRSLLAEDDPMWVSPRAVEELKKKPARGMVYPSGSAGASGGSGAELISRTAYERAKIAKPMDTRADAKDPGVVDCIELWVRFIPKDYEIDESTESDVYQILLGNEREVLSINQSTYEHAEYPYSVGEPRPSPFYQFAPSWVMLLKNLQDYVDYLKNRHQEAVSRTIGNVFLAKSHLIDIADFEDPDKEGKFISILPEAASMPINDVIRQVPIVDTTATFMDEMKGFISFSEATSGASQTMQGQAEGGSTTATASTLAQQMGTGRMTAIARLLSVQALVPQTKRIVSNFQQFLDVDMVRHIEGEALLDMSDGEPHEVQITRDSIQGSFDYRPHDGTLPGADSKKVAALSRAVEAMQQFPQIFAPGEGNIDPRPVMLDLLRASGMNVERYRYRPEVIAKAAQAQAAQAQQAQAAAKSNELRASLSVAAKWDQLMPAEREQIMAKVGIVEVQPDVVPPSSPGGEDSPGGGMKPGPKPAEPKLDALTISPAHPPAVRPGNV